MTEYLFSSFFKFLQTDYFELSKSSFLYINSIDEYIICLSAIALGFFISVLCPLVWIYKLNQCHTEDFRQSLKSFTNSSWIFQNSKYGLGGDRFFPGSALLAQNLLCYGPGTPQPPTYIVNLSDSVKNTLLLEQKLEQMKAPYMDSDTEDDDDFVSDSLSQYKIYLEYEQSKQQEAQDLEEVEIMRKILGNLHNIKDLTRNWSLADFYISLTVRVVIREIYPAFSDFIDKNIEELYEKPFLGVDLTSFTNELRFLLKEKKFEEKFRKQKPRSSSRSWFFIFQFIILNYQNAVAENKPLVLYNKTRTDFITLLKTNNFLDEQKNFLRNGLGSCIYTKLITDFFLLEKKNAQNFKETLWQSEILFHSMALSNLLSEQEVIVKEKKQLTPNTGLLTTKEIKKQKKAKEQEFQFYREGLLLSFEMAGISKDKSFKVIEEALKTKNKNLLLTFLYEQTSS